MTRLEKVRAEVRRIGEDHAAGGGPGIEYGIADLVAALHYCGFRTTGSCEGHHDATKRMYPWVILTATNTQFPIILRTLDQKVAFEPVKQRWKSESKALKDLISRFNHGDDQHKYPRDENLCLIGEDKSGAMLAPVGAKLLDKFPRELITQEQCESILCRYQGLMKRFAEFLIRHEDKK